MKISEKSAAIKLRQSGNSIGDIATTLGVSKSSVSVWVRDVALTAAQRGILNKNGHSVGAIEKRRTSRILHTTQQRQELKRIAKEEASQLSQNILWCIGVSLYWGEGGKTQNIARISNSDPVIIRTIMRFFREYCDVPEQKFRGQIHVFEHTNKEDVEKYWSVVSGIPTKNFFKTYSKKSSASKNKRHSLPNGTFQVFVNDTKLFYRIMGWIEYLKQTI